MPTKLGFMDGDGSTLPLTSVFKVGSGNGTEIGTGTGGMIFLFGRGYWHLNGCCDALILLLCSACCWNILVTTCSCAKL
jgi:hypothetical protein